MSFPWIPPAGVTAGGTTELSPYKPLPKPPVIRADRVTYKEQSFLSVYKDRDPVDAAVIEALWRVRGSGAAVQNTGARFLEIEKIDDRAATTIANEARTALSRLIRRGDIAIIAITANTGPDWAEVVVRYNNLRTPLAKKGRLVRKRLPEEIEDE